VPFRARGDGALLRQPEVAQAMRNLGRAGGFAEQVDQLEAGLPDVQPADRRANVEALVTMLREYQATDAAASAAGFTAWAAAALRGESGAADEDAVDIVTFHRAKGLEWPVVFVCGVERGLVPIGRAETPAERAEERRLFYVALTRAERELHVSWAEERSFGSKTVRRQPSPWLFLVGGDDPAPATLIKPPRRPTLTKAADTPLLAELKAWRREKVKASSAPAYTVFDDKTLAAIANHLPRTEQQLLDVPGIGPVKLSRYGDEVLAIVARHSA
jgi:DNA helicase-2/ATP-dependent DNA helicase PcrA